MATRPERLPTFATDDVYDATGEAWDGLPNKVAMPEALAAEGFEPTQKPPAQHFNWLLWILGQWVSHLANAAIANWRLVEITDSAGDAVWAAAADDAEFFCGVWIAEAFSDNGEILLFGELDSTGGSALAASSSALGERMWSVQSVDASSPGPLYWALYNPDQALVLTGGGAGLIHSRPVATTTWTQRNSAAGEDLRDAVFGSGTGTPRLVAVGEHSATDDMRIYSSTGGTAWTLRASVTDRPMYGVANKPGAMWVAVGDDNAGGAKIYRSPDAVTWVESTAGVAGDALRHVVYDARVGLFLAVGLNGARLTSPDGITWTDLTDVADAWLDGDPIGMATDGEGSVLVVAPYGTGGSERAFLSSDGGVTWTEGFSIQVDGWVRCSSGRPFWAGQWGWVMPGQIGGLGTPNPGVYASGRG